MLQKCIKLTPNSHQILSFKHIFIQIRRAIQILSRRTKNNPILLGEPGVGKTAIAEGRCICTYNNRHNYTPLYTIIIHNNRHNYTPLYTIIIHHRHNYTH
jgi:replication-associated recombination protein RarA